MPLATIVVVCALLTPPRGAASPARQATQEQTPDSQPAQTSRPPEPEKTPASTAPAPAQENPPSPSPADTTQTTPQPEPEAKPETSTPVQEAKPAENPKPAQAKPHANVVHRHTKKKPAHPTAKAASKPKPASSTQGAAPPKKIVRNGGTGDPAVQLSPSLTQQQSSNQRKNIDQLLAATDANLKKLSGRQLSSSQTDTTGQIRQYVEQSKTAADAGDMERARNLATKARLLSEELVKH